MKPIHLLFLVAVVVTVVVLVALGFALGNGLQTNNQQTTATTNAQVRSEDLVFQAETAAEPDWIPANQGAGQPWYGSVYLATSTDGLTFSGDKVFLPHTGVPNLIQLQDGTLVATFQYFSYQQEGLFDKIAYTTSSDNGATWSPVSKVDITGLPPGPNAVDPTLVQLSDGSLRLYFTYETAGDGFPQLYSAKADSIDDTFVNEGKQLTASQIVLDPAVVYFQGMWHHFTQYADQGGEGSTSYRNVHSTSTTGLNFTQQDDVFLTMQMLGDVIVDNGGLRFYGSGQGVESAFSTDGSSWQMDTGVRAEGADPGVAKLDDGGYVMLYSK